MIYKRTLASSYKMSLSLVSVLLMISSVYCHLTDNLGADYEDIEKVTTDLSSQMTDHRFFLQQIFAKYGHDGKISFEGFEHLLESLGLGNIIIGDHDVMEHKEKDAFLNKHETHEHPKKDDASTKRGTRAFIEDYESNLSTKYKQGITESSPIGDTKRQKPPTTESTKDKVTSPMNPKKLRHKSKHRHEHNNHGTPKFRGNSYHKSVANSTDGTNTNTSQATPRTQEVKSIPTTPSSGQEISINNIPELLYNITFLVQQHQELKEERTEPTAKQCLSPRELLEAFDLNPESSLNPVGFLHLCPAIIYELDQRNCLSRNYGYDDLDGYVTMHQWLYATVAIVVISLCGLFSVAVIPIMQKWFYHTLLQFLVGLAVGSLSGDALLHLLPHAMVGHDANSNHGDLEENEKISVWRGLSALGGIFFFFIAERLLGAFSVYRQKKISKKHKPTKIPVSNKTSHDTESNGNVGEKLSRYRRNSYDHESEQEEKEIIRMLQREIHPSRKNSTHSAHEVAFHGRASFSLEPGAGLNSSSDYAITVSDHHGHGHGHSHEVPQSVSAVAWMVIMGDGLHNFCDGLAIGVAFASGIEGGISTTIAVFCHELPHELGDFAMLLKTGMKVKQALFYNGLSSVLCFIGMLIGVSLGNVESTTSWVFAGTAGMFLYIALVDMLPELATTSEGPGSVAMYTLAVQLLGMSIGISVMLLIANYEHDLKTIIS